MDERLFTLDPINNTAHLVGIGGINTTSAAFTGGNNGLFEIDYLSNLYSIDPQTGRAALIGATGLPANNGNFDTSLSTDGHSLLYTAGRAGANDELYMIDAATGHATDLGSTGVTAIAGSAFVNGQLELYQYGQAKNYIYTASYGSVNFSRKSQLYAQIVDGGVDSSVFAAGASIDSATPEPASIWLMAIIMLHLISARWSSARARLESIRDRLLSVFSLSR